MVAIFDLDGFLADFEGYLVMRLDAEFGSVSRINRHLYDFNERFKKMPEMASMAHEILMDRHAYRHLNADPYAKAFVEETIKRGNDVMFLTSRPKEARGATENWLSRLFGRKYDQTLGVEFTLNKTAFLEPVKESVSFVIDDNPEEVVNLNKIGIPAAAWRQPWNEGVFPCVERWQDGRIWLQPSDDSEGDYFWNWIGDENEQ